MYLKVSDLEIAKRPVAFNHFRPRLPQRWSLSWDTFTKLQWMAGSTFHIVGGLKYTQSKAGTQKK